MRVFLIAAAVGSLAIMGTCASASLALAQVPDVRVFGSWDEPVKLVDGSEVIHRFELSYDYRTNSATLTVHDAADRLISTETVAAPAVPHPEEIEEGRALIEADPELGEVMSGIAEPTIQGGFIYFEGACGELRCLQFTIEPADGSRLERFVIVELSEERIIERDLHPNLRH